MGSTDSPRRVRIHAGGRVNLIGEHTDYTGGLALPMAIALGTTVEVVRSGNEVRLRSSSEPGEALVPVGRVSPDALGGWARYIGGVVAEMRPSVGAIGTITSDLPIGAGLSSSASLQIAVALALGFDGTATELALLCQRAEQRSSGVPCGVMDQMAIAHGEVGAASLIDCHSLQVEPVPIPDGVNIVVIPSGQQRELASSAYRQRRDECAAVEAIIGPLRQAGLDDVNMIDVPVLARRARHVVTENQRVRDFVVALESSRFADAGALLAASHASLRDDFEVTSPAVDATASRVSHTAGVYGARMVGGGFGGVIVALADPGCSGLADLGGFAVEAAAGPTVELLD